MRCVRRGLWAKLVQECLLFGTAGPQATQRLHSSLKSQPEGHNRVRIVLISKSELGLHIVCNFGVQARSQWALFAFAVAKETPQGPRGQLLTMIGL